jgi:hypothetical protein
MIYKSHHHPIIANPTANLYVPLVNSLRSFDAVELGLRRILMGMEMSKEEQLTGYLD